MSSLFLNTNEDSFSIHPVVVFSVLDSFKRRREGQGRVIGCLLGYRENNKVSIEESFVIPHVEDEDDVKVNVDFVHVEKVYSLYCQANPKLTVVGWYSTNTTINHVSPLINKHLMEKFNCINPILVTVDTSLQNDHLNIAGYTSKIVSIDNKPFHIRFDRVPIETKPFEAERIAIDAILNGIPDNDSFDAPAALASDSEAITASMMKLSHQLDQVGAFLSQVADNKITGDANIGRALAEAIAAVPTLDKDTFHKMFSSNLQDMLLVAHLANIARNQTNIADKLSSTIL